MLTLATFLGGFILLILGADWLVKGSSRIATLWGLSPVLIGLTIVAFGTSAPEFAISILSAARDQTDITFGNVVGSNICNTLLILGLSAIVTPLVVVQKLIRVDVPIMIVFSLTLLVMASNEMIGRQDGLVLIAGAVLYIVFTITKSKDEPTAIKKEYEEEVSQIEKKFSPSIVKQMGLIIVGLIVLCLGAHWLVEGASTIARILGISELIIGLTIVAFGTSLPELATSIIAALRGHQDMAVGNIIGSNIINIVGVLGVGSLVAPYGISVDAATIYFDLPFMVATAIACLPIFFTGFKISRWEGVLFLAYYIGYITYLILKATNHSSLSFFSTATLGFIFPLTALTLILVFLRELRAKKKEAA